MINIAVCDDDMRTASLIESLLLDLISSTGAKAEVEIYSDGEVLFTDIRKGIQYDLIYLDIEMQNLDGISLAHKLRKNNYDLLIIYVSNHDKYLKELFEVETFRFLSKPIDIHKFAVYFNEAISRIQGNRSYYTYQFNRMTYRVRVKDILYFESSKRSVVIHLSDKSNASFYGKLNDIEKDFVGSLTPFLRIHQSYLVNYAFIRGLSMTAAELVDGTVLQISEDRQKIIGKQYAQLLRKELFDD